MGMRPHAMEGNKGPSIPMSAKYGVMITEALSSTVFLVNFFQSGHRSVFEKIIIEYISTY
jgi:hypothetical protein